MTASRHAVGRSRLGRNARLARMGARVGGTYATTAARKTFASTERREALDRHRELRSAQQVADELGHMKGALMKLGQMASYLDDGLPEPLRLALSQLQSNAPPMSIDLAIGTVERELGGRIDQLFVEFDPNPIAAASIGQVHRAIIRDPDSGSERAVAVKVQYPGIADAIVADLRNADLLGAVLRQGFGGLDPAEMVDEIKLRIAEETDYELEARHQQMFADYYRDHPFIRIPEVVPTDVDESRADHRAGRGFRMGRADAVETEPIAIGPARSSSGSCSAASTGWGRSTVIRTRGTTCSTTTAP